MLEAQHGKATGVGHATGRGALVISLDFELAWGVFDTLGSGGAYRANLLGAREAVPRILELFAEYGIAATWATVGFLFAESREELLHFAPPPASRPSYSDSRLDPYAQVIGDGERDDPLHYASSLVAAIAATPKQEVGSHTFSHYAALEPGQTFSSFQADLHAAAAIARARGIVLKSLVMPRHQTRADYLKAYGAAGFLVHRGNEPNRFNAPLAGTGSSIMRAVRLSDSYLNLTGNSTFSWEDAEAVDGLHDVPESRFLRPLSNRFGLAEPMRRRRIIRGMTEAAVSGRLYHLWWHPHNFGGALEENLANLRLILEAFRSLRETYGYESYGMLETARLAGDPSPTAA